MGKQLYDPTGNAFMPLSDSISVSHTNANYPDLPYKTVSAWLNKIWDDLKSLDSRLSRIDGSEEFSESLGITITYAISKDRRKAPGKDAKDEMDNDIWLSDFLMPTSSKPYAWKRTIYLWNSKEVLTVDEIITTALYPETQFMYAAVSSDLEQFLGPKYYPEGGVGNNIPDIIEGSPVTWSTEPISLTVEKPLAYMAKRTRQANEDWESKVFTIALFGRYAFNSVPVIKYYITLGGTPPDPNQTDGKNITAGEQQYYDQITENLYTSGTNYVWSINGSKVNGVFLAAHANNTIWSLPSLISIVRI